ncbi:MAG: LPS export ABC transporter periplasmic protein LptC [Candidatus Zixiibacteriota bacterium]
MMKKVVLTVVLALMSATCMSCGSDTTDTPAGKTTVSSGPDQVMTNSEIYLTSGGRRKATIKSDTLFAYARVDTTLLYNVHVLLFDSTGAHTSTVTSDSARVSQRANTMSVFGHVKAWTNDNRRLVADSLRWNAKTEKIETEGYVEIYRGEDMISGFGLEADQRLERTIIKRKPRGTFNEPEKSDL